MTDRTIDFSAYSIDFQPLEIDFGLIGSLLLGRGSDNYIQESFVKIGNNFNYILLYNLILVFIGVFLGWLTKVMVRNFKLDRRFKILRFQNEWHYVLSAEMLDFPKVKKRRSFDINSTVLSAVWIDALIDMGEKQSPVLYSGILEDYKLSKDGGLDLLYLTNSYRRSIDDDHLANSARENEEVELKQEKKSDLGLLGRTKEYIVDKDPYYYMPEHYFILKYSEVKNLNIYYDFSEKEKFIWENLIGYLLIIGVIYLWYFFSKNILVTIIGSIISIILSSVLIVRFTDEDDEENEGEEGEHDPAD